MAPVKREFASGSGASYATFDEVENLRRQIVVLQDTVASHQQSLESGNRMFEALSREREAALRLTLLIAASLLVTFIVAVVALVTG